VSTPDDLDTHQTGEWWTFYFGNRPREEGKISKTIQSLQSVQKIKKNGISKGEGEKKKEMSEIGCGIDISVRKSD
jgi:hypothetical protein